MTQPDDNHARIADDLDEMIAAADKFLVTVEVERNVVMLRVDTRAIADPNDIQEWWLSPSDDQALGQGSLDLEVLA